MVSSTPEMIRALSTAQPVLQDLNRLFPLAWQTVHTELNEFAHHPDPQKIARTLTLAHDDWHRQQREIANLSEATSHKVVQQSARLLIRKLALEQFCVALTQTTLTAGGALRLHEKLLFKLVILKMARATKPLKRRFHQTIWKAIKNRGAATYALHQAGCYTIFPSEFITALAERIGANHKILEIGAGRGLLSRYMTLMNLNITAVDDYSWQDKIPMGSNVIKMDGSKALAQVQPTAVISCWPPPSNTFEAQILRHPSVHIYVAIVSQHRFASGNWGAYAGARSFKCVESKALAKLLLPVEAESTVLIFSRI